MEFHEKLQQLRKQRGLTQEELAKALYVSRTAVSKWESGKGYPGIESLMRIAEFFSVTVDDLLSGKQLLTIAEEERKKTGSTLRDLVFGTLDLASLLLLFLPFFGQSTEGSVGAVSLLALEGAPPIKAFYLAAVAGLSLWGVLTLALQSLQKPFWQNHRHKISFVLGVLFTLCLILGTHPYAAALLLLFLTVKALLMLKRD
jgi:transcriptional regulator with XRE-family HTH domain